MNFTFLISCEPVSDRSRTGVCVGSSKIDFQLAGYTFYLTNITWTFDILDPAITSPDACLGQARINDRRGMMVTCIIRLLPTPLRRMQI